MKSTFGPDHTSGLKNFLGVNAAYVINADIIWLTIGDFLSSGFGSEVLSLVMSSHLEQMRVLSPIVSPDLH